MRYLKSFVSFIKQYKAILNRFVVAVFFVCFVDLVIHGHVEFARIVISFVVILSLSIYKYVLMNVIYVSRDDFNYDEDFDDPNNKKNKILTLFIKFVLKHYNLLYSYPFLIKILYYVLYYFPTNGPFLFIMFVSRRIGDLRLFFNSNKDILFKIFFNKDATKTQLGLNRVKILNLLKGIGVPLYRTLFLFLYFKIKLIEIEGKDFFKLRIFAIIYVSVLISNNLHFGIGFTSTELLNYQTKAILVCLIVYIFLLELFKTIVRKKHGVFTFNWDNLYSFLKYPTMEKYYDMKHFLIPLVLCQALSITINKLYLLYMDKNKMNASYDSLKVLLKIGRYRTEIAYTPYMEQVTTYEKQEGQTIQVVPTYRGLPGVTFNVFFIKHYASGTHGSMNDMIGNFEKNYMLSLCLFANIFHKYEKMNAAYQHYCFCISVYQILYGKGVIDQVFGEEIEELHQYSNLVCLLFDYIIFLFGFQKKHLVSPDFFTNVPHQFRTNYQYNKQIEIYSHLFDLNYHAYTSVCLIYLDPAKHINYGNHIIESLIYMRDNQDIQYANIIEKMQPELKQNLGNNLLKELYISNINTSDHFKKLYHNSNSLLKTLLENNDSEQIIHSMVQKHMQRFDFKSIRKVKAIEVDFYNNFRMKEEYTIYDKYAKTKFKGLHEHED